MEIHSVKTNGIIDLWFINRIKPGKLIKIFRLKPILLSNSQKYLFINYMKLINIIFLKN
jgi:hypothetical protein